jgi:23S rRNA pseudouridine1911/1915/1917 synthase
MKSIVVVVTETDDVGARADVVLGRRVPGLSRRAARAMALEGRMRIEGKPAPPSTRVTAGVTIELRWPEPGAEEPAEPTILEVTDRFVYVAKPRDVHTHRLRPDEAASLADAVVQVHPECARASSDPRECGAVSRLDRETTGVVPFARSHDAWLAARTGLSERRVAKLYIAFCDRDQGWPPKIPSAMWADEAELDAEGTSELGLDPPPGTIPLRVRAPLGHGISRAEVAVRADGLDAESLIWPVAGATSANGQASVLALELRTGRRHQARAHLAWLDRPVVNDHLYGAKCIDAGDANMLMLHGIRVDLGAVCPGERPVIAPAPRCFLSGLDAAGVLWRPGRQART